MRATFRSSAIRPDSPWHAYAREERNAPWKILLPLKNETSVLAADLKGSELASLARSGNRVFVHKCSEKNLIWAMKQGESLGQKYQFDLRDLDEIKGSEYAAIVIEGAPPGLPDPGNIYRLLAPGGTVVWIENRGRGPRFPDLKKLGFENIKTYAIIPPGSSRVMLPLVNRNMLRAGLGFYIPGKWPNRIASGLCYKVPGLVRFFFGNKKVVMARKPGGLGDETYFFDWLRYKLDWPVAEACLYTGWTKVVVQVLDKEGKVLGIAKLTDSSLGYEGIQRERVALKMLEKSKLSDSIPKILATGEWGGHAVQVQTELGSDCKKFSDSFKEPHRDFLDCLNKIDRAEGALEQLPQWAILWRWANEGKFSSSREGGTARAALERCWDKLGNKKILFHRIHGDFTPFHALLAGNKLVVADWEESEPVGLPLYDAIHFIMARDIHLKRSKLSIENLLNKYKIEVFKELTASGLIGLAPVPDELFELALICAYTFLTHPQLRYAAWNE